MAVLCWLGVSAPLAIDVFSGQLLPRLPLEPAPPATAEARLLDNDGNEADNKKQEDEGNYFLKDHRTATP